jgi:hypothetical protein
MSCSRPGNREPRHSTARLMKGKLQEYALFAEIIGAVGVVISLIYVGVGVRQNTEAIHVANHQALVAMDMDKNAWLRDPEFAAVFVNAREDFNELSPVQSLQYLTFAADTFNAWEFAFITHSSGAMSDTIWNGWDGFYRSELQTDAFRRFWEKSGKGFSPDFRAYVNSVLSDMND